MQVAVCGPANCTERQAEQAYEVGQRLARAGAVVFCGGGSGVMAAVAAGVRSEGGVVVGIRPDDQVDEHCADLTAVVLTRMGEARNAIIVRSADAVIAVGGSWGTLSEIALATRRGDIPVVVLEGWTVLGDDGVPPADAPITASTPEEAVTLALR